MLRLVSAFMFVLAGGVFGLSKSEKLKADIEYCRKTADLMELCIFCIRYRGLDVYEVCREIKKSVKMDFAENLPECYSPSENFHQQWKNAVCSQKDLSQNDYLLRLGEILGTSDTEGQVSAIDALKSEVRKELDLRKQVFLQKNRFYISIGILFGLMAGILVI